MTSDNRENIQSVILELDNASEKELIYILSKINDEQRNIIKYILSEEI